MFLRKANELPGYKKLYRRAKYYGAHTFTKKGTNIIVAFCKYRFVPALNYINNPSP
jgi:hypothetical protein